MAVGHSGIHDLIGKGRGRWCWPKVKGKVLKHEVLRNTFRANFLARLRSWMVEQGPDRLPLFLRRADGRSVHEKLGRQPAQPLMPDAELINAT
jgi:hypothetical protein